MYVDELYYVQCLNIIVDLKSMNSEINVKSKLKSVASLLCAIGEKKRESMRTIIYLELTLWTLRTFNCLDIYGLLIIIVYFLVFQVGYVIIIIPGTYASIFILFRCLKPTWI